MTNAKTVNKTQKVEVRSLVNDNAVITFEQTHDESVNLISVGYSRICKMLGINRVEAESRYYVSKV